ncbi:hypothetical protein AUK22_09150 [bacterium CG2_30_54_10]|nr:MAG: hypothetical protein AUK22_09150 [bacterium CG2_30_54_10]
MSKRETLLLPQFPPLQLSWENGSFVIDSIPEWIGGYLGLAPTDLVGKNPEEALEPFLPGLITLANQVIFSRQQIQDLQANLTDRKGQKHPVTLTASYKETPEGRKFAIFEFQESPTATGPELPDVEKSVFFGLVGFSSGMQRVFNKIRLYGASDAPVLVNGETGSGKEGVAFALHHVSKRRNGPFVTVNCTAITETLFESELFGHEKGSFTGAIRSHRGRFERASGGTLFLDEIGDLPVASQAKLLRVLEEEKVERVGSEQSVKINVRIVAATNRNLEEACSLGSFRPDLFFRLNALQIRIPPLRERIGDIPLLIRHFVRLFNDKYHRHVVGLTREAIGVLESYQWPGNIRELRNLLERLFAENQTDAINQRALKEWVEERVNAARFARTNPNVTILPYNRAIPLDMTGSKNVQGKPWDETCRREEREELDESAIRRAFAETGGNITKAAGVLGVHKATFYRLMKTLKLSRSDLK